MTLTYSEPRFVDQDRANALMDALAPIMGAGALDDPEKRKEALRLFTELFELFELFEVVQVPVPASGRIPLMT